MKRGHIIFLYALVFSAVVFSIFYAPAAAHRGWPFAKSIYNVMSYTCHQYIFRSFCLFYNETFVGFGDCDRGRDVIVVETNFTSAPPFNGFISFDRSQIGINRADVVLFDDVVGYKLAVCSRCLGVWLGMLLGVLVFAYINVDEPLDVFMFGLFISPLTFDGVLQLFGVYETNNLIRLFTGLLGGTGSTLVLLPLLIKSLSD